MNTFSVPTIRCRKSSAAAFSGDVRLAAILFSAIFLLSLPATLMAQTQLGTDIDGEAEGDQSGNATSLSSDGNRLAVGALFNGDRAGHVRVYQWLDAAWTQLGIDIDAEAANDFFGLSVSLSSDGHRLAIGANGNDGNGADSGHVRVYQWSGEAWTQLGSDIDGEAADDRFGDSVSLSADGSRLAIGAGANDGNGYRSGHARVYQWSGTAWVQLGADIDGKAVDERFGESVSLSSDGNQLAIGAPAANETGPGLVRVYQWLDADWVQLGVDIDGEAADDRSGGSVSLSSDGYRLAIGASGNDGNGDRSGHVRVYQWSDMAWVQLGTDIDGEAASDQSGASVSLSSDGYRLAIGAPSNDGNGNSSGHTRLYQWLDADWVQLGVDIDGEAADDRSGGSVSLSSDGNRLAVGASKNDGNGDLSGHVRVYDLSMFNAFRINPGLNDAWYNPETDGQGFFITVFPDLGYVSLAWFTYDTVLPPEDAVANLGDAGHRWLTALGPIAEDQVVMNITMTSGGIFDTATEIQKTDPPGSDGTIILTFDDCNSATVEYDIPAINRQGIVPIRRVANDNIVICEALKTQ